MSRLMGGTRKPMNSVLEYNYLQIHADASASYVYQLGTFIFFILKFGK